MKQLSIIIPIYNVEDYLERCLRSIEEQDIQRNDYEIICINDGSSDNSRELVMRLQNEFENIILINQENQGVSIARNNGIDLAKGEYLLMVDADDYIQPNILKKRLDILIQNKPDIALTGYIVTNENLKEEYRFDPNIDQNSVFTGINFFNKYLRGKSEIRDPHRSWANFFKTSFFNTNNLRYLANVPYLEDGELMARVICLANRVIFINEPFYTRTTILGSATHSRLYFTEKARSGFLKAAINLLQFKNIYCKNDEQKMFMNQPIVQFTILFVISHGSKKYIKHYSQIYCQLKNGPLKVLELKGCNDFYKKMGACYNFSIHYFYLIWKLFLFHKSLTMKIRKIFSL
jgi:glycosyltransferase involved in cell wall biosynthesis